MQALCVIHCLRKGRPNNWIWLIDFLPDHELAEKEFRTMKGRFANYEARYYYAPFLAGADRVPEARQLLNEMLSEVTHLSPRERRYNANWLRVAKDQLYKLNDQVAAR